MLSREEADKILKAAQLENPDAALAARVGRLPPELAKKTLDYLQIDSNGKSLESNAVSYEARLQETAEKQAALLTISEAELDLVIAAWFPHFANLIRPALGLDQIVGYYSSSFRRIAAKLSRFEQIELLNTWREYTGDYDQPLEWMAEYASYEYRFQYLIPLYVAAIHQGNDAILTMYIATCNNEHPISGMGNHVIQTLLQANKPEGWTIIEKLLLAAQRQEGLRQSILNLMPSAHPEAIRRMLHLIGDHDLLRFSSSVQWAKNHLPLLPAEPTPKVLETALFEYLKRLENPEQSRAVLKNLAVVPTPDDFYKAAQIVARLDLEQAQMLLLPWLEHPVAEARLLALEMIDFLQATDLAKTKIEAMLFDPDQHVSVLAYVWACTLKREKSALPAWFSTLEKFLANFPQKVVVPAISTWTHEHQIFCEDVVAAMFYAARDAENPQVMLGYREQMYTSTQQQLLQILTQKTPWAAEVRELVQTGINSKDDNFRSQAIAALSAKNLPLEQGEYAPLEKVLTRKTANVRKEIIRLILEQPAELAASSAARLKANKNPEQQKAGEEIARALAQKTSDQPTVSAADGFGLFSPAGRTPAFALEAKNPVLVTDAAKRCLESLNQLVKQHLQTVVQQNQYGGDSTEVSFANFYFYNVDNLSK